MSFTSKRALRWVTLMAGFATLCGVSAVSYRLRLQHLDRQSRASYLAGRAALAAGDSQTALQLIRTYVRRNRHDATALYYYAKAREQVAEPDGRHLAQAIRLYVRFLDLEPDHVEARRRLLDLYMRSHLHTEALHTAHELLARVPGDPDTYRAMAVTSARLARDEEALRYSQQYNAVAPTDLSGHVMTLDLMLRCGRPAADVRRMAAGLRENHRADSRFELLSGIAASIAGDDAAPPSSTPASAPPSDNRVADKREGRAPLELLRTLASVNAAKDDQPDRQVGASSLRMALLGAVVAGGESGIPSEHGARLTAESARRGQLPGGDGSSPALSPKSDATIRDILSELQRNLQARPPVPGARGATLANGASYVFAGDVSVPLPPALWAGFLLLGGIWTVRLKRRRRGM